MSIGQFLSQINADVEVLVESFNTRWNRRFASKGASRSGRQSITLMRTCVVWVDTTELFVKNRHSEHQGDR